MKTLDIIVPNDIKKQELKELLEKMINENVYTNESDIDPDILENLKENLKLIGIDIFKKNYLEEYKKNFVRDFFKRIHKENEDIENICFCLEGYFEEVFDEDLFQDEEEDEE